MFKPQGNKSEQKISCFHGMYIFLVRGMKVITEHTTGFDGDWKALPGSSSKGKQNPSTVSSQLNQQAPISTCQPASSLDVQPSLLYA